MMITEQNGADDRGGFPEDDSSPIYSPAMEEPQFDARQADNRRAFMLFGGAIAVLLIIAFLVLKAYGSGTRGDGEVPRIIADTSPYKSQPDDPGGKQTPNQDISVYDRVNGEPAREDVTIIKDSEEPVQMPARSDAPGIKIGIRGQDEPDVPASTPEAKPAAKPAATPTPTPAATASGDYAVQVAALRSQADAETLWTGFTAKHSAILPSGYARDINRVDRGERGIFYQLRVAGFSARDEAKRFCEQLKTRGQDCLVVRR
ncbi:SPOR domain-containing protein [Robiginitomaculum antarcticum]|uniref:SPOR domain-containing protein n=1 Tax=Robiginitomaculum antarcticum TaxID=437507 RepID=UPI000366C42F|nr:SPOR domain-containing protein [Robiginitomaculum antarcticum]